MLYSAEFGGIYSINNRTPFWIKSNQYGVFPDSGNTVFFRQILKTPTDSSKKYFKFSAGAELNTIVGKEVRILLPEAYLSMNLGKTKFMLGRQKQVHGFVDTTLTSGSITWSGNALPIPEVQFSIPEYLNIFHDKVGIKGHFSHGWFGDQPMAKGYFLHQKSLYVRLGKPNAKIKLYGGILHHAQWAGEPKYEIPEDKWLTINDRFAGGLKVYKDIIFPLSNPPRDSANVASFDFENRYGNHLGQVDIGGEINAKNLKWLFYKQLPFETGQTFSSLGNLDDGLYGISISSKDKELWFQRVVFEFLHTTNQGMYRSGLLRLIGFHGKHYGRNQNFYFNHFQYLDGWSYERKTIGTPFMVPSPEIRDEKSYQSINLFNNNNNIKAGYIGLKNRLSGIDIETRVSYSINFGSSANIFQETANQLSFSNKLMIPLRNKNSFLNLNVGIEQGTLIKDNFGFLFSYVQIWN